MRYKYVEGLAEIARRLRSSFNGITIKDFKAPVKFCDYCGARIRYKIFFMEGFGVGSECASQILKYLDMLVVGLEIAL